MSLMDYYLDRRFTKPSWLTGAYKIYTYDSDQRHYSVVSAFDSHIIRSSTYVIAYQNHGSQIVLLRRLPCIRRNSIYQCSEQKYWRDRTSLGQALSSKQLKQACRLPSQAAAVLATTSHIGLTTNWSSPDHFFASAAKNPLCSSRRINVGSKIRAGSVCFACGYCSDKMSRPLRMTASVGVGICSISTIVV